MDAAARGRPRGRLRHRERRHGPGRRSAAAHRRAVRPARRRARARERLPRDGAGARVRAPDRAGPTSSPPTSTRCSSPGGHAPGMRQYLGGAVLQRARSPRSGRSTGRSARSATACSCSRARREPDTGRSVLAGRRTTCLPEVHGALGLSSSPPGGSAATTGPTRRTSRTRCGPRSRPGAQFERGPRQLAGARHRRRRRPGLRGGGRQLRVRPLARRRLPVRPQVPRPAHSLLFNL